MGTIYRNGIPYVGTEAASQVHYDNTDSGISSTSVQGAIDELNNGLITEVLYASAEVRVYKNNKTILCTFNDATIAQITTALQNTPRPGGIVRNVVWNYTDAKAAVISIGANSTVTFIHTDPWGIISDTSKHMHGEITWLASN